MSNKASKVRSARSAGAARSVPAPVDVGPGSPRSKADHAYAMIRARILAGDPKPGKRLVIEQLARELDVSAVPVREAIRRLEAEGYVTYTRNVGATVGTIDLDRYPETVEALAVLEAAATALAMPHLGTDDLAEARRINADMRRSVEALDPDSFTQMNHRFHETLYRKCPNSHILDMVNKEWILLGTTRRSAFTFVPERAIGSVGEHERLVELIESGRPPAQVEAFARAHRMRTVRYLLSRISDGRPATGDHDEGVLA
jgi:DNA-binding GntR family transcriptional regulator